MSFTFLDGWGKKNLIYCWIWSFFENFRIFFLDKSESRSKIDTMVLMSTDACFIEVKNEDPKSCFAECFAGIYPGSVAFRGDGDRFCRVVDVGWK